MKAFQERVATAVLGISGLLVLAGCCCGWPQKTPTPPLGTQSDCIWRRQEAGASASDFVIYQNEFVYDPDNQGRVRFNTAGEDHIKSIAARLHCGAPLPVIIERSMTSKRADTEYQYPIHPNPELDMKRRELVVKSLIALGITNAEQTVVVAPALAAGYTAREAARAYDRGVGERGVGAGRGRGIGAAGAVP
jgi:hypothetical protein